MVADNLNLIRSQLPKGVTLVAVSKYYPVATILEAYNVGQRVFGESRALEMRDKYQESPKDIQWHFIGHLQKNKVKYIAPFVSLIHSVDSVELLQEIDRQAKKNSRKIKVLLEFHIAQEETKSGFKNIEDVSKIDFSSFENIEVCGVMGMATDTPDKSQIEQEFSHLYSIFEILKLPIMSAGMSNDYKVAISCGSNMIRIGSAIFQ
ncbi:MAG: YggS family pyridoxal phosphate-dependent enzyme [Bacteroidales bacterium]|jgi:pyridoxal phosphate enzyme (YggS family)|nr:YggS family pyridoxal phosphate-dependent enzyme [Bacteroidales bacterium]